MKLQDAVKKETVFVTAGTFIAGAGVCILFYLLHKAMPESVPFGLPVILGSLLGCGVASLNFFMMALMVQKVASMENQDMAYQTVRVSFRQRMFLLLGWGILALVIPAFNGAAGIIPLFIPSLLIKARGIFMGNTNK